MDELLNQRLIIENLLKKGFRYAVKSRNLLTGIDFSKDSNFNIYKMISVSTSLSESFGLFSELQMFLEENYDKLGNTDIFTDTVNKFIRYNDEVINSFAKNHSLQYSHEYFDNFLEHYKLAISVLHPEYDYEEIDNMLID